MSYTSYQDIDMAQFVGEGKKILTFEDVCAYFDIDIEDDIVKYLLNVDATTSIYMDQRHLDMMGLTTAQFHRLLRDNPDVDYDPRAKLINAWDFELLCMQVDNEVGARFRQKTKHLDFAFSKYWEYKNLLLRLQ